MFNPILEQIPLQSPIALHCKEGVEVTSEGYVEDLSLLWDLTRVNTLITKPGRAAVFLLCANRGNVTSLSQFCSGRGWGGEGELLHQGLDNGASWPLLVDRCHFSFQPVLPGRRRKLAPFPSRFASFSCRDAWHQLSGLERTHLKQNLDEVILGRRK